MTTEEENLALKLIRGLRGDVAKLDAKLEETRLELKAELRGEMNSLRADLASNIRAFCRRTGEQIEEIRQTVVHYHAAAVGQASSSTPSRPRS